MRIAILDPFSGISGDMTLGALLDVGLEPSWLVDLPRRLGLEDVGVEISEVLRGEIACRKVDFVIPPQPHGRHLGEIRSLVAGADLPAVVRERADRAFTLIAEQEAAIHGLPLEQVHLHEVGAVDAILDVVGAVWGFEMLGVERVFCGPIQLGDGFVRSAHGLLPVPAPATMRILEGLPVRPGPEGAGELVTPTGAALVRVLSSGPPPGRFVPRRSGFGAGTRDFRGRANALRIVLGDAELREERGHEELIQLAADLDDMSPEYLAAAAEALREEGALDVVLVSVLMKKGRAGTRLEALVRESDADRLERVIFERTTTIGVRRWVVQRRALDREARVVEVLGQRVQVKLSALPDGRWRAKPEYEDVRRAALAAGRTAEDILKLATEAAERRS